MFWLTNNLLSAGGERKLAQVFSQLFKYGIVLETYLCSLGGPTSKLAKYYEIWVGRPNIYSIQVEPGKPGAEVSKKKTISQRKNLPIECAQGDQPLRCPNRVFE